MEKWLVSGLGQTPEEAVELRKYSKCNPLLVGAHQWDRRVSPKNAQWPKLEQYDHQKM